MQDLIKAMRSLSDETRLRILGVLTERECCVCEVMQALSISQSRASRNLGILKDAGFLKARREGAWVLYCIDREGMKGHYSELVDAVEKALEGNEAVRTDRKRLTLLKAAEYDLRKE